MRGYVLIEDFRCWAEILNMPQRELRSGAAFRMTIRGGDCQAIAQTEPFVENEFARYKQVWHDNSDGWFGDR